ncbi:MAG: energy-coupling factor transport system substrate-specific component [Solirubrobacterales bacterium]|nr:energy-coupling factor transport system substrate-specific component [Solirubrobacterales bacterium]
MSWQLASFSVLATVLAGGFAWYELSRPPSQVLALVAAMAALAVAGRLALAPLPNVVPTTDVVLVTGFAIGAAPGFATGALAALVSNFWLGQGPWTPWQMAAWGLCGIAGALLARASGGRAGRLRLAAACGMAGLGFGALMDFSSMLTYGGEVSLDRYAALSARAIPFNLAHAIGNVTLALVAGPTLVRMLFRFRRRFETTWRPRATGSGATPGATVTAAGVALLALLACLAVPAADVRAAAGPGAASSWLEASQNDDGGFAASRGGSSNVAMSGWTALGLEAAGHNPADVRHGGADLLAYLRTNVGQVRGTGDLERTIMAVVGAGGNPRSFGGTDLVARLAAKRSSNGSYSGQVNLTAFGAMAMRAAGVSAGASASWLRKAQNGDGGWGFQPQAGSDADSTGAALQAMRGSASAKRGVAYLRRIQRPGGGFALAGGGPVNTQSTAWAVQGIVAAGTDPSRVRKGGKSPLDYLAGIQAADGHYRYSRASDQTPIWVTGQALLAVRRRAFPLAPVPAMRRKQAAASTAGRAKHHGARRRSRAHHGKAAKHKRKANPEAAASARKRLLGSPPPASTAAPRARTAPRSPSSERLIGGGVGAAVLGGGFLLWYRRRYGSLPWS